MDGSKNFFIVHGVYYITLHYHFNYNPENIKIKYENVKSIF